MLFRSVNGDPLENFFWVGAVLNRAGDALALVRPRRLGADVASAAETASKTASKTALFALLLSGFDVVMTLAEAL